MDNKKYLLYEFTVPPEHRNNVKAAFAEALPPTLQEPGCQAMYGTSKGEEPNRFVFEVFSLENAHKFHMEQPYTKKLFASLPVPTLRTAL